MPHAVFGALTLSAAVIEQGGVVRAPLGNLIVGSDSTLRTEFLPGSETSVSGNGIVMPYGGTVDGLNRSEEHTSELQSLMRISYAVFCLKKKKTNNSILSQN